ncbi:deoxyuridine 5'triphosphatenucleotidohydrolase [Myxoma virus]|uniref:Deoxyuridine 5'-triphosphate nucleotidohydrolase n=1 Tax=Myxoma virus TaxID=10273 RepID=K4J899_9POXV|nr:deoxyuridine 5'triphosphatenucleotidohydrolase [Myxoma virus]AFU79615.1 deoxyuridine 5'triphosphatenucleotidohydrolase [Myxoma virus]AFU80282.1 deoxyuridine 5'triphosphatenucleotidohydrolase [Myxoma virus]AGW26811.1 deoxyuridine 5'triphosphatenucleotidohydrolase [Myxoma virus]QAV37874.1 deoxyuridine 5'triphosphatenucleotidohydrolase [Myxoma virus]
MFFYKEVMDTVKCVKFSEHASLPTKATADAAGYDLYSAYAYIIPPHKRCLVKTDIGLGIPEGCYGRIAPRSGMSLKFSIDVGGGVIDRDYRGNIGIILINNGNDTYYVKKGDKVAQIIFEKVTSVNIENVGTLNTTARGHNGFGSSGY